MFLITTPNISHKGTEHNYACGISYSVSLIYGLGNGSLLSHTGVSSAFLVYHSPRPNLSPIISPHLSSYTARLTVSVPCGGSPLTHDKIYTPQRGHQPDQWSHHSPNLSHSFIPPYLCPHPFLPRSVLLFLVF